MTFVYTQGFGSLGSESQKDPFDSLAEAEADAIASAELERNVWARGRTAGIRGWPPATAAHEFKSWAPLHEETIRKALVSVLSFGAQEAEVIESRLRAAFGYKVGFDELCKKIDRLEAMLEAVLAQLEKLESTRASVWIPIDSLAPRPYEVLKPFTAVVAPHDEGFEAALYEVNLYGFGDTENEALADLKETVVDTFARLSELSDDELGPEPKTQKLILGWHLRRISA